MPAFDKIREFQILLFWSSAIIFIPIQGQQTSKANYFVLIFSKKRTKNLFNYDMIKGKNKVEKIPRSL